MIVLWYCRQKQRLRIMYLRGFYALQKKIGIGNFRRNRK